VIGTKQYNLTWDHFAQLHPNRQAAFENLCRSLFRRKLCEEGTILHSDPNHPGVEVQPVYLNSCNCFISFQAKFFNNNIGYKQIKQSAQKIVAHYKGHIDKVYLYCNKDISSTSKSYEAIEAILKNANIELNPITGQSIFEQAMEYPSVLSCYFGLDYIDDVWFNKNIQISLDNLGKRYNSLFNIDTRAQRELSIFLRDNSGIASINDKKTQLLTELNEIRIRIYYDECKIIDSIEKAILSIPDITLDSVCNALLWEENLRNTFTSEFEQLQRRKAHIQTELENLSIKDVKYDELRNKEIIIDRILAVPELLMFSQQEVSLLTDKVLLLKGEMGTGKSHLLSSTAKRMIESGRSVLLLLGQTFITSENIETQIMSSFTGLNLGQSLESLLAVLDERGFQCGEESIIFIDAINESRDREIWKNGINRLIDIISQFKKIKLVISLRSGFENLTLTENVLNSVDEGEIACITHQGLPDDSPSAIYDFLSKSGVPFSSEYYLQSEMTNPLFLMWFCQTYTGKEWELYGLIDKVIDKADLEASKEIQCNEPLGLLKHLLYELIDYREKNAEEPLTKIVLLSLSVWNIFGVTQKTGYIKAIERFGIITSYVRNCEEIYYFGYNLLEDYLSAKRIIDQCGNKETVKEYCLKTLIPINEEGRISNYRNESVFIMLTSLYASRYGEECINLVESIPDEWDKQRLIEQYFGTYTWRSNTAKFSSFVELLNKYPIEPKTVWQIFIENATKDNSEINAEGLSRLLKKYDLNYRDYIWTIVINDLSEYDRVVNLAYFLEQGNTLSGLTEKKAELLLTLFAWLLSSSNRSLRDRVSKAMIEVLKSHLKLCKPLLTKFSDVNDPYILQRLYGVVFGAVIKRNDEFEFDFTSLASWIYQNVFSGEFVYPDILFRDYARLIVERYVYEYPDNIDEFDMISVRPPYKSALIPQTEIVDYSDERYNALGVRDLLFSMKFDIPVNGVGMYGNFGRYTLQSALRNFIGVDLENIYYYSLEFIFKELGYEAEMFGKYDSYKSGTDRHYVKKVERIGKKYQWIAMYNILARISDTHKVKDWTVNGEDAAPYKGPWNPYVRDFDPTLNCHYRGNICAPLLNLPVYDDSCFISYDASVTDIEAWTQTQDIMFSDFPERLIHKDKSGVEWICLYSYQEHKTQPPKTEMTKMDFSCGEQHIWSLATPFLIQTEDKALLLDNLNSSNFIDNGSCGIRNCYSLYNREYAWSPGYIAEFDAGITNAEISDDIFENVLPAAINVLWEEEFDASQEEATSFMIPSGKIIQEMGLFEKENDGYYYDGVELAAFDMKITGCPYNELVIRKDCLSSFLEKSGYTLFWTVIGEKQYFCGGHDQKRQRREGYFVYKNPDFEGEIHITD